MGPTLHTRSAMQSVLLPCRWADCNETVNHDFDVDALNNYDQLLPPMMADGIRIMIYVGMEVSAGVSHCLRQ